MVNLDVENLDLTAFGDHVVQNLFVDRTYVRETTSKDAHHANTGRTYKTGH